MGHGVIRLAEMDEEDVQAPLAPDDGACKGEGVEVALLRQRGEQVNVMSKKMYPSGRPDHRAYCGEILLTSTDWLAVCILQTQHNGECLPSPYLEPAPKP